MDRYKKKALKFDKNLGYGRNLRAAEINSSRALYRNSRFSVQRKVLDLEPEEEHKPESRIPAFGKPALKPPQSREQMLQKWKAEKEMKRELELQKKKPIFRIGVSAPKSVPVCSPFGGKADSTFLNTKNSQKISFNATHLSKGKENGLKPPSIARFQASSITHKKTPHSQESHIQAVSSKHPTANVNTSSGKQESQIRTVNSKPAITHFSYANAKKESQIKTFNSNLKPPRTNLSHSNVKKELPGKSINSKPSVASLSNSSGNKASQIQAVNSKLSATYSSNSNTQKFKPPTGVKPIQSNAFKKPEQAQPSLPGRIPNRLPESKIKPVSQQNSGRMLKVPSRLAAPVRPGIPNKTGLKPRTEIKPSKKEDTLDSNITFSCNISTIEPVEEIEKSFAPKDFTFNFGADVSFSYLEEGPIALYNKLKAGEERTSTPKMKEIMEIQRREAENGEAKNDEQSFVAEQAADPQVTANVIAEVSLQQNITTSPDSKSIQADTNILTEDIKSGLVSEKRVAVGSLEENSEVANIITEDNVFISILKESIAEKPEIDCSVTKNCLEDEPLMSNFQPENCVGSVPEGLSVIEESQNLSLSKPSVEEKEVDELIAKQVTLEINENNCSTALNNKKNISLEKSIEQVPVELNKQEIFTFEATKALTVDKNSSVRSCEEKENIPEDVFDTVQNVEKTENTGLDDVKEPLKLKSDRLIDVEDAGVPAMPGTSSSSDNQFKVPVFEGDAGIASKRRSSSKVSNMSLRLARRSEMPQLESISESIESSSPCKTPPKPPKTPKSRKSTISKDFTPRRSLRLARNSVLETTESLFDVRLSLCGNSPDLPGNSSTWDASQITYDFDKLDLEQATEPPPTPQRRSARVHKKVSLLYTPPQKGRVSTLRKSIRGDLMAFSPEVAPK